MGAADPVVQKKMKNLNVLHKDLRSKKRSKSKKSGSTVALLAAARMGVSPRKTWLGVVSLSPSRSQGATHGPSSSSKGPTKAIFFPFHGPFSVQGWVTRKYWGIIPPETPLQPFWSGWWRRSRVWVAKGKESLQLAQQFFTDKMSSGIILRL